MPSQSKPTNRSASQAVLDARSKQSMRYHQNKEDEARQCDLLKQAFATYLEKWHGISELASTQTVSKPISGPIRPFMRFQDVPWPLIEYTSEIEIYPLTAMATIKLRSFLTMCNIPKLHEQIQMNYEIWVQTDVRETIIPFVFPQDRLRVHSLAWEISRMMLEDRYLAVGLKQIHSLSQTYGRKKSRTKDEQPPARPGVSNGTASGGRVA